MNHAPLLTIMIANYNYGHLLESSIERIVANCDITKLEILIIDDHSTDHSLEIIQTLASKYPIRFFQHPKNLGVHEVGNTGVRMARGRFLHLFGADDLYLPGGAQKIIDMLQQNPHVQFFSSPYASFTSPEQIKIAPQLHLSSFCYFDPQATFNLLAHTRFWIPGHTVFVNREIYQKHLPLDPLLYSAADWYINCKIALQHGIGYFPEPLVARREAAHSYSSSLSIETKRAMWEHLFDCFEQHPDARILSKTGHARILGLKGVFHSLIKKPRYWKHLYPASKKLIKDLSNAKNLSFTKVSKIK